ncbi:MAG: helix-turn-helix domain-containing protein [Sphaerochaeta associata]|uniref:helix-turn-helix domain-containing protein n=1 Tax=Sphaerochaeta associata TaxID=1129264 RepID=UPI002B219257|nr:helix-turn-helix domain-containing protein [Sphaerochaeta associata]MEA5029456.1 helix-turn-helix domain-containing protein [Sphaerochaeta associata]
MQYPIQTPVQLGSYLRTRRKALGLTQKEAALRIGLLPKTISALENDPLHCSIESLLRLLSALDLEFLLQGKEDAPQGNMWK